MKALNENLKIEPKCFFGGWKKFNEKFCLIAGREYFQGKESEIKKNFIEIVNENDIVEKKYCLRYLYNLTKLSIVCVTLYFSLNYFI